MKRIIAQLEAIIAAAIPEINAACKAAKTLEEYDIPCNIRAGMLIIQDQVNKFKLKEAK